MNALFSLTTVLGLPPPPAPTANPTIDTAKVIGIVLICLGLIAVAAMVIRPFVARPPKPNLPTPDGQPTPEPPAATFGGERAIIRFPALTHLAPDADWESAETAIADRFQRVVGHDDRRRKLGDRDPSRPPHRGIGAARRKMEMAAWHEEPAVGQQGATVIPLYDRPETSGKRGGAGETARNGSVPLASDRRVWSDPQSERPGTGHGDRRRTIGNRKPPTELRQETESVSDTEPFVVRRRSAAELAEIEAAGNPMVTAPVGGAAVRGVADAGAPEPVREHAVEPGGAGDTDGRVGLTDRVANEDVDETAARVVPASETDGPVIGSEAAVRPADAGGDERLDDQLAVDPETQRQIAQTIRELIFCANTGEVMRGLALYSDEYLFRTIDDSGMTEAEFLDAFSTAQPRPPETWDRLEALRDVAALPDGRVGATASYVDPRGERSNGLERYRFVYDPNRAEWMIDDIAQVAENATPR